MSRAGACLSQINRFRVRAGIDAHLAESEAEFDQIGQEMNARARAVNLELFDRLDKARQKQDATLE